MDQPLVSVIMPAHNAEKYIAEAIESIVAQTYKNWELIVIDDGSSDNTPAIINNYHDKRIKILLESNAGQSIQMNKGIAIAKGKYIAIAHADDINYCERLNEQVNFLNQNQQIDLCGTFAKILLENTTGIRTHSTSSSDCYISLFYSNPLIHPTVMIRKTTFEKLPFFYQSDYKASEDYDLWVRLADFSQMANLDKVLIDYRMHESSNSSLRKIEEQILEKRIRLKLVKLLLKTEKRSIQLEGYYFFYLYNKLSFLSIWRVLFRIKKSFEVKTYLDISVLHKFLEQKFIVCLKQKPYCLRLIHAPLAPLLFIIFPNSNAWQMIKTLFFSKS